MVAKFLPYLKAHRWQVAWALAQVFLIAGFELLKPWPLQVVIDNVLRQSRGLRPARRLVAARAPQLGLSRDHRRPVHRGGADAASSDQDVASAVRMSPLTR